MARQHGIDGTIVQAGVVRGSRHHESGIELCRKLWIQHHLWNHQVHVDRSWDVAFAPEVNDYRHDLNLRPTHRGPV